MKGYRDDRITRELEALYPFWQEKNHMGLLRETAERFRIRLYCKSRRAVHL